MVDSKIQFNNQSAPATPASGKSVVFVDAADKHVKLKDDAGVVSDLVGGGGGGEVNTASNVGIAGVGLFKQKTGVDLEFKKVSAGSSKISITDDVGNDEVDVDVIEANLVHQNLSGSGTNTHSQIDTHIADTANPHATDVGNLGSGVLAELNAVITDATLDDAGDGRPPLGAAGGDLAGTYPSPTIAANAVSNTKLGDVATETIKGRITALTGDPEDLTAPQVRTLLNVADGATATPLSSTVPVDVTSAAASAGVATEASKQDHKHDIAIFSGPATEGVVPDPTAATGKFLKDDGTWAAIPGGGDMLAATYDPTPVGADAFDSANHAYNNAVSGLTATKTQGAIDEVEGRVAINDAKVSNATHTGDVTGATALTIAVGAVDIPMHSATGTADATTFLRGDNTWNTPAGGGGGGWSVVTETTAARSAVNNEFILVNVATCVITLPAPAINTRVGIKVIIATVTDIQIRTSGAGITIDGTDYSATGLALTQQYEQINLISDGSNWIIY